MTRPTEVAKRIVLRKRLLRSLGRVIRFALETSLAMCLFVLVVGCDSHGSGENGDGGRNLQKVDDSENATSYEEESENTLVLEHDFGILKPEQQVEHAFVIENETAAKWTVRKIINMCACTVSDLSAPAIEPGGKEEVTVAYRAGSGFSDDRRKVVVLFGEAEAPSVILVVRARVRESMTCVPSNLEFTNLGLGRSQQANFEVQNFDDHDWESILLQTSAAWLEVHQLPLKLGQDKGELLPRQAWRITVTANATAISYGDHNAKIVVAAEGTENVRRIAVHASVISPAVAIPEQFFFGKVTMGNSVTRRITIRFAPDAIPKSIEEVNLQHTLGHQLRLSWSKTGGEFWELEATFTPNDPGKVGSQKVNISFSEPKMPSLALPVYALVEAQ